MPRIADPSLLRAEGALLPWRALVEERIAQLQSDGRLEQVRGLIAQQQAAVSGRPAEIHLRWACAPRLGVPPAPFSVWTRGRLYNPLQATAVTPRAADGGLLLTWTDQAAMVEMQCDVIDPERSVALFALHGGHTLHHAVAAVAERPTGPQVTLRVRTSGATGALLVNGRNPVLRLQNLNDLVNAPGWRLLERVGLPVARPWNGTTYDTSDQGLVDAPTRPADAATQRLRRGGPPIGWPVLTGSGQRAPEWRAPDPQRLLKEIQQDLLPQISALYQPGVSPRQQADELTSPRIDSRLPAQVELPPLHLLTLTAATDPFLALATGFGTAYGRDIDPDRLPFGHVDFLVTADYPAPTPDADMVTMCAFVPWPPAHTQVVPPTNFTAERAGLLAPGARDRPWRETVRLSWDRTPETAGFGRPTGGVAARVEGSQMTSLVPRRAAGDYRPLLLSDDGPEGSPGADRTALVDGGVSIDPGSGKRLAVYAATVQDVFGVWSPWAEVSYQGPEPGLPLPRLLSLNLAATWSGSAVCPATLDAEVSVDWAERTPLSLDLALVFFPMPNAAAALPADIAPEHPAPTGGFRREVTLPFSGDTLNGAGDVGVDHLNTTGDGLSPPGDAQGQQGRRYRLHVPVPTLDFTATPRWGVAAWIRTTLRVPPVTGAWTPISPARASAASPVPVIPLALPQPPGVPIGSLPDAGGRAHVRVFWSLPAGADVARVVVWEVTESALRQVAGLQARVPKGTTPSERLQALYAAYDELKPDRRRSVFRRLLEVDGSAHDVDIALPRGSTDIHLFALTTITPAGVESPWPEPEVPHTALQAAAAPRLRRPDAPSVRSVMGDGGTVTFSLRSRSRVEVREFRLYRTRVEAAARSVETMGPPFAVVADPVEAGAPPSGATSEKVYQGTWSGHLGDDWDEWYVRAVAVPADFVPLEAVRGTLSEASDILTLSVLPTAAPDLAPLIAEPWSPPYRWVHVRTSFAAPARAVPLGSYRLTVVIDQTKVSTTLLQDLPERGIPRPLPLLPLFAVITRSVGAAGRTLVDLSFNRLTPTVASEIRLVLTDPLGGTTERTLTLPAQPVAPTPKVVIVDQWVAGQYCVLRLRLSASVTRSPPYGLTVRARTEPESPLIPAEELQVVMPLNQILVRQFPDDYQKSSKSFRGDTIEVERHTLSPPHEYIVTVPFAPPVWIAIILSGPDGQEDSGFKFIK